MIKGVNHIGLSVVDLDRSVAFYRDSFGMEVLGLDSFEGSSYERILALSGVVGKTAMLRRGNMQLELFEFQRPTPQHSDPNRPVNDHGITHFCIEVEDVDAVYARLSASGTRFHCPPLDFDGIARATYGRDPDGNVFELLQLSETKQP